MTFRSRRFAWIAGIPTVVGLVATSVGLAFDLFPGLQPPPPCRGTLGGHLRGLDVDDPASRGTYLDLTHGSRKGIPARRLDEAGRLIKFRFDAAGFKSNSVTVWTSVLTADGAPVARPELANQLALSIELEDCKDGGRRTVWTRTPTASGRYLVEIRLLDPDNEELDSERTAPFTVRS
jgi:hypothetical protein